MAGYWRKRYGNLRRKTEDYPAGGHFCISSHRGEGLPCAGLLAAWLGKTSGPACSRQAEGLSYTTGTQGSRFVVSSRKVNPSDRVDLSVQVGALRLANPIIAASGTFGYGLEFAHLVDLNRLGGLVTKGLSLEPIQGAP